MSIPAQVKYIGLSLLFAFATINLTRTTLNIIKSSERLNEAKREVLSLEEEKKRLEKELAYRKTDEFIEEKARNQLSLIRPGEQVFIVPEVLAETTKHIEKIRC